MSRSETVQKHPFIDPPNRHIHFEVDKKQADMSIRGLGREDMLQNYPKIQ